MSVTSKYKGQRILAVILETITKTVVSLMCMYNDQLCVYPTCYLILDFVSALSLSTSLSFPLSLCYDNGKERIWIKHRRR